MPSTLYQALVLLNIEACLAENIARIHQTPTPETRDLKLFTHFLLDPNYTLAQKQGTIHLMVRTYVEPPASPPWLERQNHCLSSWPCWQPETHTSSLATEHSQQLAKLAQTLLCATSCLDQEVTQSDRCRYLFIITKFVDLKNDMSPLLMAMESRFTPNLSMENRIQLVCKLMQLSYHTWTIIATHWPQLFPSFSYDQSVMQQLCAALLKHAQDEVGRHSSPKYFPLRPVVDSFNKIMHSQIPVELRKHVIDELIYLFIFDEQSLLTYGPEDILLDMTRLLPFKYAFEILTNLSKLNEPGSLIFSCMLFQNILVDTHQKWHIFRKCEINDFSAMHAFKSRRVLADLLPRLCNDRYSTCAKARQLLLSRKNQPIIQDWIAQYSPEEKNDLFARILDQFPKIIISKLWPELLNYLAVNAWEDQSVHLFKSYAHCLGGMYTYYHMTRPTDYLCDAATPKTQWLMHHLHEFQLIVKKLYDQGILMTSYENCSPNHRYRLLEPLLHSDALDEKEKMYCLAQCMSSPYFMFDLLTSRTLTIIRATLDQAVIRRPGLDDALQATSVHGSISVTSSWLAAAKGMLALVSKFDRKTALADLSRLLQGAQITRSDNTISLARVAINNALSRGKINENDARRQLENLNHTIVLPADPISKIAEFLSDYDLRHIPAIAIRRLAMGFIRSETEDAMAVQAHAVGSSLPPLSTASSNQVTSLNVVHAIPASSIQAPRGRKRPNAENVVDACDGQTPKRLRP